MEDQGTVQTRRALGIAALGAVILAAICFAAVDVSIAGANGCVGSTEPCADRTLPLMAVVFAVVGTVALLVSVVPAINWFVGAIHHTRPEDHLDEDDLEVSRSTLARRLVVDEDDA